jgi:hypothetical protein
MLFGSALRTVGTTMMTGLLVPSLIMVAPGLSPRSTVGAVSAQHRLIADSDQHVWYYYPRSYPDTVLIRTRDTHSEQARAWQCIQNEHANYQRRGQEIVISNAHLWQADLSVFRLPTDSPELRRFLDHVEGRRTQAEWVKPSRGSMLVIQGHNEQGSYQQTIPNYDPTDEEFFVLPWPRELRRVDERDVLHKQGWGYFHVSGNLGDDKIQGSGRLPLVPAYVKDHDPRLSLSVGDTLILRDGPSGALVYGQKEKRVIRYPKGFFFHGLSRPWTGLHSLDTVRRDAAQYGLPFEARQHQDGDSNVIIVSITDEEMRYDYHIDMYHDLVRDVYCFKVGVSIGQIHIDYQASRTPNNRVVDKSVIPYHSRQQQKGPKGWWLTALVNGLWETVEASP